MITITSIYRLLPKCKVKRSNRTTRCKRRLSTLFDFDVIEEDSKPVIAALPRAKGANSCANSCIL